MYFGDKVGVGYFVWIGSIYVFDGLVNEVNGGLNVVRTGNIDSVNGKLVVYKGESCVKLCVWHGSSLCGYMLLLI